MFVFFLLLVLILYVFALLGVDLFGDKIKIDGDEQICFGEKLKGCKSPRYNFDTFFDALITCFIIIIGEDWQIRMQEGIRSNKNIFVSLYYIFLTIIGHWFLMNLFLAILFSNFEEREEEDEEEEEMIQN